MVITLRLFLWLLICPFVFARCTEDQESKKRIREITQKLCSLGEMRPVRCKTEAENMKIQIPTFPKEESRLLVLKISFREVSDLLMKTASTEWRSSELQQLKNLLGLQRQYYTTCGPDHTLGVSPDHGEVKNWSTFWSSLADFLSEESFSSCAWESARAVILQVMRGFYRAPTNCQKIKR